MLIWTQKSFGFWRQLNEVIHSQDSNEIKSVLKIVRNMQKMLMQIKLVDLEFVVSGSFFLTVYLYLALIVLGNLAVNSIKIAKIIFPTWRTSYIIPQIDHYKIYL